MTLPFWSTILRSPFINKYSGVTISNFQSQHKIWFFKDFEMLPSYVCHSDGGVFLKACLCKANQVHKSCVEADRTADGVRLVPATSATSLGETSHWGDEVVQGAPLVPGLKSFFQRFLSKLRARLQRTKYCLLKLNVDNLLWIAILPKIHDW